jgi:hypothetical protein
VVFPRLRPLTATAARVELRRQQVAEQGRAIRRAQLVEVVLDPRPPALLPGRLEPIADPVDPVQHVDR